MFFILPWCYHGILRIIKPTIILIQQMKEEEAGLISNLSRRKSNKPKDIKRRFYENELRIKRIKNKNITLQRQYENEIELQGNLRLAIQEHCEYLKSEVEQIMEQLEGISLDYPDTVTNAKIRDLLKKTKKEIVRSREIMNQIIQRASAPFFFRDNEVHYPDTNTTKSQEVGHRQKHLRKRSTSPHHMGDAFKEADGILIAPERLQTNKDEIKKFIEMSHLRALQLHKQLNDRVGDGQDDLTNENEAGDGKGRVKRKPRKITKACYIVMIIMVILVVVGAGVAIYMLFY